jgi:hypothetical protein
VVESTSNDAGEVHNLLQNETMLRQSAEDEANDLKNQVSHWKKMEVLLAWSLFCSVNKLLLECPEFLIENFPSSHLIGYSYSWGSKTPENAWHWSQPERETWRRNRCFEKSVTADGSGSRWGRC